MWVYSISQPNFRLIGTLTKEIYCQTKKKNGNAYKHAKQKYTQKHTETETDTFLHYMIRSSKITQRLKWVLLPKIGLSRVKIPSDLRT